MIKTKQITDIMNCAIKSMKAVIPLEIQIKKPKLITQPVIQNDIGVLIGITGDLRGRLILRSEKETCSHIGQSMFGMPIEGEMLPSFTGELGNMIGGNLATFVEQEGFTIDITPPTVIEGQFNMYGFQMALELETTIDNKGKMDLVLALEDK